LSSLLNTSAFKDNALVSDSDIVFDLAGVKSATTSDGAVAADVGLSRQAGG
jgi:hypothetical protein